MAYFLKKTKTKYDIYLQIYESFYDPKRKGSAHRSVRPIGYVKKLIASGIEDPIAYFKDEVNRMNAERNERKALFCRRRFGSVHSDGTLCRAARGGGELRSS